MERNWTEQQKAAIEGKGSILVSASAGTGKTAVLSEKIAKNVLNDTDISNILVMTFSAAAANEMKDRIKKRLKEELDDKTNTASVRSRLWSQLKMFNNASIQTIHSFCNDIVKKYFYKVDLDPTVKVADNYDVGILKIEAVKEVLALEYAKMDYDFISLEETIDGTASIEDVIIDAYNKIVSFIDYRTWLNNAVEKYNIKPNEFPTDIKTLLLSDFDEAIEGYEKAIKEAKEYNDTKLEKIIIVFKTELNILKAIRDKIIAGDIDAISSESLKDIGQTVRFPAKMPEYDNIKTTRNIARDIIVEKYKKTNFSLREHIDRIRMMYPVLCKFRDIIIAFDAIYTAKKKENKVIDFNDMEKYAYEILRDDEISYEYKNTYKRVYIDEYQDTSPIQEAIIERVSKENNLFCVGDLKQSIYRFRSSDPTLFARRSDNYENTNVGQVISLNSNFRSAQNILDCANDVFNFITTASSEIRYTENDKLNHGRKDDLKCNPVCVEFLPDTLKDSFPNLSNDEIEVYNIVKTIKNTIGTKIYDAELGEYRPAEFKDIVVLCRKLSGISDYMAQILSANNIPFIIEKAGALLETLEVEILMNIIDVINNSRNDVKLLSIMHLGLFDFTDDDIIYVKNNLVNKSYYETLLTLKDEISILGAKCQRLFSFIDSCKEKEKYISLTAILEYIISELNYVDYFAVMNNGTQRVANIKQLQKHAADYEIKSTEKLYGFSKYLKDIAETGEIVDEAKINYSDNSVRITTIHKSKGLEYPIVILGFMGKTFNQIDKRANIIIDYDAGIGIRYYNHDVREKGKCLLRTNVERIVEEKNIEEEMRLLYVAMTRAKEYLYIQGVVSTTAEWHSLPETTNMLDWIVSTLTQNNGICFTEDGETNESSIILDGHWNISTVKSEDIQPYFFNESNEVTVDYFLNKYNVPSVISTQKNEVSMELIPLTVSASGGFKDLDVSMHDFKVPDFINQGTDSAHYGTVVHNFMKYLDFTRPVNMMSLMDQAEEIIEAKLMSEEDVNMIDIAKIHAFLTSEFGQRMLSADEWIKEKNVNIMKKGCDVGYLGSNDDILIRCIIDLMFVENGKYYLVDYKTDNIKDVENKNEIKYKAESHRSQLEIYKEAMLNMYGIVIDEIYVVFIESNITVKL